LPEATLRVWLFSEENTRIREYNILGVIAVVKVVKGVVRVISRKEGWLARRIRKESG
jgi:hypothetical protein